MNSPNQTTPTVNQPPRICTSCNKSLGEGEMYVWGQIPLCFECKKIKMLETLNKPEEWLLGNFVLYKNSILRSLIFGMGSNIPFAVLFTNKRVVLFNPDSKKNKDVIRKVIEPNKELLAEVARLQKIQGIQGMLMVPFFGVFGAYLYRKINPDFKQRDLSLASVMVSIGSGRLLSREEVDVLCALDRNIDCRKQGLPFRFYQMGLQKALAKGWWKMADEQGNKYVVGFNVREFGLFYEQHFCQQE